MDSVIHSRCTRVLDRIRETVGDSAWQLWFACNRFLGMTRGTLQMAVPNAATREWVRGNYAVQIERIATAEFGTSVKLEVMVHVSAVAQREARVAPVAKAPRAVRQAASLGSFMPHSGSDGALKAVQHFVNGTGPSMNPLLLCGGVSTGKTHLVDAAAKALQGRCSVLHLQASRFVQDYSHATRFRRLPDLRQRFLAADCVILDDLQDLAGKTQTQRELASQLKELLARRGRVLVASRLPLQRLQALQGVLASVVVSGMCVELGQPTREEMAAILKVRLAQGPERTPAEVVDLMARRTSVPLRDLELLIAKVYGYAGLSGEPVTSEFLDRHLEQLQGPVDPIACRVSCVFAVVTEHFRVKQAELLSKSKTRTLTPPRAAVAFLLQECVNLTLKQIGEQLGGRSHSAVHQLIAKVQELPGGSAITERLMREVDRRLLQRRV